MAMGRDRGLIIAFLGAALLLALTLGAYRTPAPLGADAPSAEFSGVRARAILKDLVGDGVPHPLGSAADAVVRDRIVKRLTALGYTTELQTGIACNDFATCGTPTNIIATRGEPALKDAVMLAAHYDSVPAGPGASDDGAGVANLLEIARVLTVIPAPRHPVVLLVTDGEEAGLLGAYLFTRDHRLAKQVKAAVNMDARGVSGPSFMFETGSANAWLMRLYGKTSLEPITNSLSYVIYKTLPNNTDFTVFKGAAYQGFNLAFLGDVGHYHTPLDNWENSSAGSLQHQGASALSALLALARSPDLNQPASDSMFFDVMARTVLVWPVEVVLPAALAVLVLLLGAAALLIRKGYLSFAHAAYGFLGALVNVLSGGLLSLGVLALLRFLGRLPPMQAPPWIAHPLAMHIGFAALSVLITAAIAAWFKRRAGFWGFWFGAALLIALLSVAAAAILPGADYVLLLAALAAALAVLPCLWAIIKGRTPTSGSADLAALVPGLVMLALLLPLLLMLYSAIGTLAWLVDTVCLCMTAGFLLPLLCNATRAAHQRLAVLAAAATFGGICITVLLPTYSASWPQRVNVEYWIDGDSGGAHWWTQAASLHLPRAMAEAVHFDPKPRERFAAYPLDGFFAPAPPTKLAAPELEQVSASAGASMSHVELLLHSPRGAPAAFLIFPASAAIADIVIDTPSGPLHAKLHKLRNGATIFRAQGLTDAGLKFGIDATAAPLTVQVFDESYGLPEDLPDGKALRRARPQNATSSQDGDVTVVQRTVRLDPAAGR
ncbi:MAG TPA: M28 family peptidase [Steroidobacteraceae bacterium]|nr:M28 family peptidase [Steroidobacteraceae bacterium]